MTRIALQLTPLTLVCAVMLSAAPASRAQAEPAMHSYASAHTLPEGSSELALFQLSRLGLSDRVEVAFQPLMPFFPQAEVKVHLASVDRLHLGTRLRLAYPTWLLRMLSGEGAMALLPADTDVPQALLIEADALASLDLTRDHVLTVGLGLSVAPRSSFKNVPVLDFPFLYARFAPLWTAATGRLQLTYDGRLLPFLGLSMGLRSYLLPVVTGGFSVEPWLALRLFLGTHFTVEAGLTAEYARYPSGLQHHTLPYLDLLLSF